MGSNRGILNDEVDELVSDGFAVDENDGSIERKAVGKHNLQFPVPSLLGAGHSIQLGGGDGVLRPSYVPFLPEALHIYRRRYCN